MLVYLRFITLAVWYSLLRVMETASGAFQWSAQWILEHGVSLGRVAVRMRFHASTRPGAQVRTLASRVSCGERYARNATFSWCVLPFRIGFLVVDMGNVDVNRPTCILPHLPSPVFQGFKGPLLPHGEEQVRPEVSFECTVRGNLGKREHLLRGQRRMRDLAHIPESGRMKLGVIMPLYGCANERRISPNKSLSKRENE